jgi:hypothetical protein
MQQTNIRRPLDFRTAKFHAALQSYCRRLRNAADTVEMVTNGLAYSPAATVQFIKGAIEPGLAIALDEIKTTADVITAAEAKEAAQRLAAEIAARIAAC